MPRPLKVWTGSYEGISTTVIATRTKKEAYETLGVGASHFNAYWGETGNARQIEVALAEPGVPFHIYERGTFPVRMRAEEPWHRGLHYQCENCMRRHRQ